MAKSSEEISRYNTTGGKTDSNLANDALHLGGVPADEFATEKYVQDYHNAKEELLKEYIDEQDASKLQQAKSYTDVVVQNQDFSAFAKVTDVQALEEKTSEQLAAGLNVQKEYTDEKVGALASDVNQNFDDVGQAISSLNRTTQELFTSVSNGKSNVAAAITDQGVETASDASFDTMASNIRRIPTGGGEPDPYYVNTGDGTAEADDIMLGKTAYVKGEKVYGSHVDTGRDTSDATATPYDILQGQTAYVQGQKITGILDISGETPTYASPDGVEKIYGGSSRDYKTNSLSTNGAGIDELLYNSRTKEIVAGINFSGSNLYVRYFYNGSIVMTRTIDLSSILSTIQTTLQSYPDYSSDYTFETSLIGATRLDIQYPYIALYSTYGNKIMNETMVTLLPLVEVHTPQNGATIVTWEIDSQNIIYHTIVANSTKLNSSPNYLKYVDDDGCRIALINLDRQVNCVVFVDEVNWSVIKNTQQYWDVGSWGFSEANSNVIPILSKEIIIVRASLYHSGLYAMFLDSNGNISSVSKVSSDKKAIISSDLNYMVTSNGNVYSLHVDFSNFSISATLIAQYTFEDANNNDLFFMADNSLIVTGHYTRVEVSYPNYRLDGCNNIYTFDPTQAEPIQFKESGQYFIYEEYKKIKMIADTLIYSVIGNYTNASAGIKYLELATNYEELIALKYNGEYYYPIKGGVMTAGQGDVRAGKTFIGWMGYEEVGTMEVE